VDGINLAGTVKTSERISSCHSTVNYASFNDLLLSSVQDSVDLTEDKLEICLLTLSLISICSEPERSLKRDVTLTASP
jgi:hypothetical protein